MKGTYLGGDRLRCYDMLSVGVENVVVTMEKEIKGG